MSDSELLTVLDKESTICALSSDIRFLLKGIKSCLPEDKKHDLALIKAKVSLVQRKAQKMEKRLSKYRNAIEGLGFQRLQ